MRKLSITAVSYLNTKPLLYGLLGSPLAEQIDLSLNIPSVCAQLLREEAVDLALVPVAILPELPAYHLVSDYCIGTDGPVQTVCLYANRPLEELKALYLDHHSRTSVALTQLLLRDHWKIDLTLLPGKPGYIDHIGDATGGLVIGDRTIGLEERFEYVYDLGAAWKTYTGLPFVFAAWVSRQPIAPDWEQAMNEAFAAGVKAIPRLKFLLPTPDPTFDLEAYFTHHISYSFDREKRQALQFFLRELDRRPVQQFVRA